MNQPATLEDVNAMFSDCAGLYSDVQAGFSITTAETQRLLEWAAAEDEDLDAADDDELVLIPE